MTGPKEMCGLHLSWRVASCGRVCAVERNSERVERRTWGSRVCQGPTKSPSWSLNVMPRVRWRFVHVHAATSGLCGVAQAPSNLRRVDMLTKEADE